MADLLLLAPADEDRGADLARRARQMLVVAARRAQTAAGGGPPEPPEPAPIHFRGRVLGPTSSVVFRVGRTKWRVWFPAADRTYTWDDDTAGWTKAKVDSTEATDDCLVGHFAVRAPDGRRASVLRVVHAAGLAYEYTLPGLTEFEPLLVASPQACLLDREGNLYLLRAGVRVPAGKFDPDCLSDPARLDALVTSTLHFDREGRPLWLSPFADGDKDPLATEAATRGIQFLTPPKT